MSENATKRGGRGAIAMDEESRAIIYDGASINHLAIMFGKRRQDVSRLLGVHKIEPSGERAGYPIYRVAEAAAALVTPKAEDIADAITKMSPDDLPPKLTKEYWSAQHAKLKFEEDRGDLWRTDDIIERMSEVFKTLRMSILLVRDRLEKQTELTDRQREIVTNIHDALLNDLADALIERFKDEPRRFNDESSEEKDQPEDL